MAAASQEGWTWNASAASGRPGPVSPTSGALNGSLAPSAHPDLVSQSIGLFFMLLVDLVGIAGNAAVILVMLRTPLLKKFVFVFHLCLVDLLAALVLMPLGMLTSSGLLGGLASGDVLCRLYLCLKIFFVSVSILSILTINVDRYYYIVHPMRYEGRVTSRLVASVIACVWLKATLMSVVPALGCPAHGPPAQRAHCCPQWHVDKYRKVFVVFFGVFYFLLPVFIILTVYCGMFRVARVAAMQRAPLPIWLDTPRRRSESLSSMSTMVTGSTGLQRSSPQRTSAGGKAAGILVLVGGQFVLCWLPFFAFHLYSAMTSGGLGDTWEQVVTWIGYTSFGTNPFFYGCLNRQIRGALGKHLGCFFTPGGEDQPPLPSREGSIEENFLQFLQRTGCAADTTSSSPKADQPSLAFHIPGQILEETCEFLDTADGQRLQCVQRVC